MTDQNAQVHSYGSGLASGAGPMTQITIDPTVDDMAELRKLCDHYEPLVKQVSFNFATTHGVVTLMGKLSFIWATVVLLGGFVTIMPPRQFGFVTALVVVEGVRLFSNTTIGFLHAQHKVKIQFYCTVSTLAVANAVYLLRVVVVIACFGVSSWQLATLSSLKVEGVDTRILSAALWLYYLCVAAQSFIFLCTTEAYKYWITLWVWPKTLGQHQVFLTDYRIKKVILFGYKVYFEGVSKGPPHTLYSQSNLFDTVSMPGNPTTQLPWPWFGRLDRL